MLGRYFPFGDPGRLLDRSKNVKESSQQQRSGLHCTACMYIQYVCMYTCTIFKYCIAADVSSSGHETRPISTARLAVVQHSRSQRALPCSCNRCNHSGLLQHDVILPLWQDKRTCTRPSARPTAATSRAGEGSMHVTAAPRGS